MDMQPRSWQRQVMQALLLLIAIALAARIIYGWLMPLVPALGALAALLVIYRLLLWRRGRW